MKARALLAVELAADGRTVVRELRSQPPVTLMPQRRTAPGAPAVVHLVGSASSPLGGDRVELRIRVGARARLRLRGTAATVALPGQHPGHSQHAVHVEVADGGSVEYLPEATVVTERAHHRTELRVDLGESTRMRCQETLVLGRYGERPGALHTAMHVVRAGMPLLRQSLDTGPDVGGPRVLASAGYLSGARVLATEVLVWDHDPAEACGGQWWSLVPLAAGGALATALADDAVTARQRLATAVARHPDAASLDIG